MGFALTILKTKRNPKVKNSAKGGTVMAKSNVKREVIEGLTREKNGKTLRVMKVTKGGRGRPSKQVEVSKGHYELLRVFDYKAKPKGKRGRPSKADIAARQGVAAETTPKVKRTRKPKVETPVVTAAQSDDPDAVGTDDPAAAQAEADAKADIAADAADAAETA